ncbi:MAG: OmpA family protein [Chitinophagales bacterium]|nr:OmpA family protein [Chitinophagales bacterium]
MRSSLIIILIFFSQLDIYGQSINDTIHLYFDLNKSILNSASIHTLDSMAYNNALPTNQVYGIIGYADYIGSEQSNQSLSQLRADNTANYLTTLGIAHNNIQTITGKGEVSRDETNTRGYPEDRRVDIIIGGFANTPVKVDLSKMICKCGKPSCKIGPFVDEKQLGSLPKRADTSRTANWQIFFKEGTILKEGMNDVINSITEYLKQNPGSIVSLSGHNIGQNETVLIAGERVEYIRWRLEQYNFKNYKVQRAVAYGKTQSISAGKTEDYYRRVDVFVTK